ncbi:hypothetical protein OS493_033170 [Desmophyllum pertusum]|uniref:Uncharacterized protein n=1 Tax=Desmophyllum pertusum TaxID=174260 RepID=A0A9W9YMD3_9CNID|nr:hypothetical protein OS493_033170 [Desmophyllum pertusum]
MFALNPVIRVGGGYRRLSWKVLDVLPSIGQYDPDLSPAYNCAVCNAILPVVEKVTNSRGQRRTILTTPKTMSRMRCSYHRISNGKKIYTKVFWTLCTEGTLDL